MAHPDLNALKSALLPVASRMLAEHGEFFPYGAFMKAGGEIVNCSPSDGDEHPPSQKLIDILTVEFRRRAASREIIAAGICCDVHVARPGLAAKIAAVRFSLEHENGEAIDVFLPYDLDSSGGAIFGKMFASRRDRQFFTSPSG